jgi:hypothetical protein
MKKFKEILNETEKLNEASEVRFDQLNANEKKTVMSIIAVLKKYYHDVESIQANYFSGVHGLVIDFPSDRMTRFEKKFLSDLMKVGSFRWIEYSDGTTSVGC